MHVCTHLRTFAGAVHGSRPQAPDPLALHADNQGLRRSSSGSEPFFRDTQGSLQTQNWAKIRFYVNPNMFMCFFLCILFPSHSPLCGGQEESNPQTGPPASPFWWPLSFWATPGLGGWMCMRRHCSGMGLPIRETEIGPSRSVDLRVNSLELIASWPGPVPSPCCPDSAQEKAIMQQETNLLSPHMLRYLLMGYIWSRHMHMPCPWSTSAQPPGFLFIPPSIPNMNATILNPRTMLGTVVVAAPWPGQFSSWHSPSCQLSPQQGCGHMW